MEEFLVVVKENFVIGRDVYFRVARDEDGEIDYSKSGKPIFMDGPSVIGTFKYDMRNLTPGPEGFTEIIKKASEKFSLPSKAIDLYKLQSGTGVFLVCVKEECVVDSEMCDYEESDASKMCVSGELVLGVEDAHTLNKGENLSLDEGQSILEKEIDLDQYILKIYEIGMLAVKIQ